MFKVKPAMDQFLEGLDTLGVLSEVQKQPTLFTDFFLYSEQNIDAGNNACCDLTLTYMIIHLMVLLQDLLQSILEIKFSGNSTTYSTEYAAYANFNLFIEECSEGTCIYLFFYLIVHHTHSQEPQMAVRCGIFGRFFTGSSFIPPQGFGKKCQITFLVDDSPLPTASTCELEIRLPTVHGENYTSFKKSLVLGFKGHA